MRRSAGTRRVGRSPSDRLSFSKHLQKAAARRPFFLPYDHGSGFRGPRTPRAGRRISLYISEIAFSIISYPLKPVITLQPAHISHMRPHRRFDSSCPGCACLSRNIKRSYSLKQVKNLLVVKFIVPKDEVNLPLY
jgi:hypothetical protein